MHKQYVYAVHVSNKHEIRVSLRCASNVISCITQITRNQLPTQLLCLVGIYSTCLPVRNGL